MLKLASSLSGPSRRVITGQFILGLRHRPEL